MMAVLRIAAFCSLLAITCIEWGGEGPIAVAAAKDREGTTYDEQACAKVLNEYERRERWCQGLNTLIDGQMRYMNSLSERLDKIRDERRALNCINAADAGDRAVFARCKELTADWLHVNDQMGSTTSFVFRARDVVTSQCLVRSPVLVRECKDAAAQRAKEAARSQPGGAPGGGANQSCPTTATTSRRYRLGYTATFIPTNVPPGCGAPCPPLTGWSLPANASCLSPKGIPQPPQPAVSGGPKAAAGGAPGAKPPAPSPGSGGCMTVTDPRAKGLVGNQCVQ